MSKNIYVCKKCLKEYPSLQSLNAHARAHSNTKIPTRYCCSVLTKKEISVGNLTKHDNSYLKRLKSCLHCGIQHTKPKFCSLSCAGTYNNLHSKPDRKRGPKTKPKTKPKRIKIKSNSMPDHEIAGPYTKVYCNTCARSGKKFYWSSYRKFHPDLKKSRIDYARSCGFRFSLSMFPGWFDTDLILQYGMYSTPGSRRGVKNINGISRDHMVSVSYGWENNIDPAIIRHPANCELVRHTDNQRKRTSCSITMDELLDRIKKFESIYGREWR